MDGWIGGEREKVLRVVIIGKGKEGGAAYPRRYLSSVHWGEEGEVVGCASQAAIEVTRFNIV